MMEEGKELQKATAELIETVKLMSAVIDRMYLLLMQHIEADDLDDELIGDISRAAQAAKDYE